MSEPQRNYKNTEDEIDLRQLFIAIGNFFKGIGNGIVNGIIRIRRRSIEFKWLIVSFFILGIAGGLSFFYLVKPVYSSSLLLSSNYFNGRIVDNSIEKLNLLCKETDRLGLAQVLGIEQSVAQNIIGFNAEPFISEEDRVEIEILKEKLSDLKLEEEELEKITESIEIENKTAYQIFIDVNQSEIIKGLQPAIVNYFKNNSYIKNRIEDNNIRLKEKMSKLMSEERKIDSLKVAMIKAYESVAKENKSAGSDNLYIGEQYASDPVNVFKQAAIIREELMEVKSDLYLNKDFEVIDGLTVFRKPASAGLVKTTFYSTLISLGLAYFIIILISINRYLSRMEKKRFA